MNGVIYVRVSSERQEREGFSIPAQKKILREYAEKCGVKIVKVFEEAETAKRAGRQQFLQMVDFLRDNPTVKHILVEKTDRLYRNFKDYTLIDWEQMDLTIHLVKENEILSKGAKSHQKFVHGIKLLMAKNYSDNLSEEVIKGQTEKASQGIWPSVAPIGYKNKLDDHSIILDEKSAPLIRQAFELASTGQYSLSRLKQLLYQKGLRSNRAGKELGKEAMSRVLKNPIYFGEFVWKGKTYKGTQTPIITRHLFDRTQEVMGFSRKPKLTKHDFTFTGLLSCGHCGCAITAEQKRKKSGKTYVYYHCTNGKRTCSNVTYLREEKIQDALSASLNSITLSPQIIEWTKEALLESSQNEKEYRTASIKSFTDRYQRLDTFISKAYEDKLEDRIEPELWERKTATWKQEQREIENQLTALRQANTGYLENGIKMMELASHASELFKSATTEEKRELVGLVLSNPILKDGTIEYSYKMPFSMFTNVVNLEEWRGGRDSNPRPSA